MFLDYSTSLYFETQLVPNWVKKVHGVGLALLLVEQCDKSVILSLPQFLQLANGNNYVSFIDIFVFVFAFFLII
jgi:hypothetical protein